MLNSMKDDTEIKEGEMPKKKRPKKCPVCRRYTMYPAGKIRAGPRGGLRTVYYCRRCGYRAIR